MAIDRVVGAAVALLIAGTPMTTRADAPPLAPHDALEAPSVPYETPPGFETSDRGPFRFVHEASDDDVVDALYPEAKEHWSSLERTFGVPLGRGVTIVIADTTAAMRGLAPRGAPPPEYAVGVAYPGASLILVAKRAPDSLGAPDLSTVLAHELAHVALGRATGGAALPRWFVEGLAIHQSGERLLDRAQTLWQARQDGRLIALSSLREGFPADGERAAVAYAESADVVAHLLRQDARRVRRLVTALRNGRSFDEALDAAYFVRESTLETEWRAALAKRHVAFPFAVGGALFWLAATALLVAAWIRRRRRARTIMSAWAAQEATVAPPPPTPVVDLTIPATRDPGVPTIEHDGRQHTLH